MNVPKANLPSWNIKSYVSKVRRDFNVVPKWFSGNQLKLIYTKNANSVTRSQEKKIDSNSGLENTSVDFDTLNYRVTQKKVSIIMRQVMNLNEKLIFQQILVIMTHDTVTFTPEIFL